MAPAKLRGTLNVIFQLFVTIGILIAGLINYGSQYIKPWGWRLPLALAGAPGIFIFVAGLILPESPNSLAEREKYEQAAKVGPGGNIIASSPHSPCLELWLPFAFVDMGVDCAKLMELYLKEHSSLLVFEEDKVNKFRSFPLPL